MPASVNQNRKYTPKKDESKIINGFRFVLHHDNFNQEKRKRNSGFKLYAFWGHPHGVTEDIIYWATRHLVR